MCSVGRPAGTSTRTRTHISVYEVTGRTNVLPIADTGSSDLWVMSNTCRTTECQRSGAKAYDTKSFKPSGGSVSLQYGDSVSGTHASGPVGRDKVTLAALTLADQTLAAVSDTDNTAVSNGGAGILGLGFPSQSFVQAAAINAEFNNPPGTDTFVSQTPAYGPIVPRLVLADMIDDPLFTITLQRNTIDPSGHGQITIGQLPDDVDEDKITWVPVRLYDSAEGGLDPPTFAANEVYPLRWEVEIDGVFLDGKQLPTSTQPGAGIDSNTISALIDTGNSLIRGPEDVVNNILRQVSPAFAADSTAAPTLPCDDGHTLAFQIGGKMFPTDPRDFVAQNKAGDATTCVANNLVSTDGPTSGRLFSWNIGDPFLRSNLVVFYYGNLSHPSVDPPRIGFLSLVPDNADELLDEAVDDARKAGGNFESKADVAPTASTLLIEGASSTASATSSASSTPSSNLAASPAPTTTDSEGAPSSTPSETSNAAALSFRPPVVGAGVWSSLLFVSLSMLSSLCIL
ncbi:aspartic peptidase domain-containing protein [Fomes fomentarius]|nr:aspartic peptidase domain-containing protein [Fomes fomentarius]